VLKKKHAKWEIFWSRQLLLLLVSIFIPLIIVSIIHLFVEPAAPFWKMWLFECCVFLSSICVTQMGLALFGHFAPFFKSAVCPANVNDRGKHYSFPIVSTVLSTYWTIPAFRSPWFYAAHIHWTGSMELRAAFAANFNYDVGNYRTKDKSRKKRTCTGRFRYDIIRNELIPKAARKRAAFFLLKCTPSFYD
jgi:hypothetical protein